MDLATIEMILLGIGMAVIFLPLEIFILEKID